MIEYDRTCSNLMENPLFLSGANIRLECTIPTILGINDPSNDIFCALNVTLSNLTVNGANAVCQSLFVDDASISGLFPSEFDDNKTLQK